MFLYFAKDSTSDVFTPPALQQMCEVENVVLGMGDYGSVCYNSTSPSTSIYTTDGSGSNCSLPFLSAVSLFYTLFEPYVPPMIPPYMTTAMVDQVRQCHLQPTSTTLHSTLHLSLTTLHPPPSTLHHHCHSPPPSTTLHPPSLGDRLLRHTLPRPLPQRPPKRHRHDHANQLQPTHLPAP